MPLLFFIAATPFTPESAAQSRTIAITDEASDTPEAVVTDTPEITPAEVPTDTPTPETSTGRNCNSYTDRNSYTGADKRSR